MKLVLCLRFFLFRSFSRFCVRFFFSSCFDKTHVCKLDGLFFTFTGISVSRLDRFFFLVLFYTWRKESSVLSYIRRCVDSVRVHQPVPSQCTSSVLVVLFSLLLVRARCLEQGVARRRKCARPEKKHQIIDQCNLVFLSYKRKTTKNDMK